MNENNLYSKLKGQSEIFNVGKSVCCPLGPTEYDKLFKKHVKKKPHPLTSSPVFSPDAFLTFVILTFVWICSLSGITTPAHCFRGFPMGPSPVLGGTGDNYLLSIQEFKLLFSVVNFTTPL